MLQQLLPAHRQAAGCREGLGCCRAWKGKGKGSWGDAKLCFGHSTSRGALPVYKLQIFLLEAAVLLAVSSCVLLQLRHPLLQEHHLYERRRGSATLPKPAGRAAPSAGATPTASSTWHSSRAATVGCTDSEPVTPTQLLASPASCSPPHKVARAAGAITGVCSFRCCWNHALI